MHRRILLLRKVERTVSLSNPLESLTAFYYRSLSMSGLINPISLANPNSIGLANTSSVPSGDGEVFQKMFANALGTVTGAQADADTAVEDVLSGRSQDIHQAMIATQKADLTFQEFMAVKNKLTSAYSTIMGMQL